MGIATVVLPSVWLDGGGMSHEIPNNTELSIDQRQTLINIISDRFGPCLSFEEFTDQALLLFEDISGFEVTSDSESQTIINQLWSYYHGPAK